MVVEPGDLADGRREGLRRQAEGAPHGPLALGNGRGRGRRRLRGWDEKADALGVAVVNSGVTGG